MAHNEESFFLPPRIAVIVLQKNPQMFLFLKCPMNYRTFEIDGLMLQIN